MSDDGAAAATSSTASPDTSTTTTKIGAVNPAANKTHQTGHQHLQDAANFRTQAQNLMQNHEGAHGEANGLLREAARSEETGQIHLGMAAAFRNFMAGIAARRKAS